MHYENVTLEAKASQIMNLRPIKVQSKPSIILQEQEEIDLKAVKLKGLYLTATRHSLISILMNTALRHTVS